MVITAVTGTRIRRTVSGHEPAFYQPAVDTTEEAVLLSADAVSGPVVFHLAEIAGATQLRLHEGDQQAATANVCECRCSRWTIEEREAVITFVLGLVAEPPHEKFVYEPDPQSEAIQRGLVVLEKYNCGGCHILEAEKWELAFPVGRDLKSRFRLRIFRWLYRPSARNS